MHKLAKKRELTEADLPKAFSEIRKLIQPPKQPAIDYKRATNEVAALGAKVEKARANLPLLDAENIPAAQETIRALVAQKDELEKELLRKPPSEADINKETLSILRKLSALYQCFRLTANPMDPERTEGAALTGNFTPAIRRFLRDVDRIVVDTKITGSGHGTRHEFVGGTLELRRVGVIRSNENSHLPG